MVVPPNGEQPTDQSAEQSAEPVPIGQQDLNWTEIKQPLVFNMESTTYNRLLIRLNLLTVFPLLTNLANHNHSSTSVVAEMDSAGVINLSPEFEGYLFTTGNEAYFLASFVQPTNLQLNFELDTLFFNEHFKKQVTVNNKITSIGYSVDYVLSFQVKNTNLTHMLASEYNVLAYLRKTLWRKVIFFVGADNYNLDIIAFKPYRLGKSGEFDFSRYTFEIGSSEQPSTKLNNLLAFKETNADQCATARSEELEAFQQETSLEMDLCSISFRANSFNATKDQDYRADIAFVVRVFDSSTHMINDRIMLVIYVLLFVLVLGAIVCGAHRCARKNNCSTEKIAPKSDQK